MEKNARRVGQKSNSRWVNPGLKVRDSYCTVPASSSASCSFPPGVPYLDLSIFRESGVKSLIKKSSKDMYQLLQDVRFDGKYYRVKCVKSADWACCWDLAVRVEFFGKMQGVTIYPKRKVLKAEKRIVYKSLILVNPYQLWEEELVSKFWNIQERLEYLIARILFHECIHVMIALGNILPEGFGETDIFLEFRKILETANSEKVDPERWEVQFRLWNLVLFGSSGEDNEEEMLMRVLEIYEFLLNEKYSTQKTGKAFGYPLGNKKVAGKYSWMAAVKAGGCQQVEKKIWKTEAMRLRRALVALFDAIDRELKPGW
jgi:hypothetical protein